MNQRVKVSKEKIPAKVWREAESIAGGLYRMNATSSVAYAFKHNQTEICYGEFIFRTEVNRLPEFDGYIKFPNF